MLPAVCCGRRALLGLSLPIARGLLLVSLPVVLRWLRARSGRMLWVVPFSILKPFRYVTK